MCRSVSRRLASKVRTGQIIRKENMKTIRETIPRDRFWLEKREREIGSTTDQVVFRLDGYRYGMDLFRFKSVMEKFDIDAMREVMSLPAETVDRRPLWKKDMDMRMGRTVDFRVPSNHLTLDLVRMEHALSQILAENKK